MKHLLTAAAIVAASIAPATAKTLTFEATDGIRVVRWVDMFGSVVVEMITEPGINLVQCVAVNAAGDPLASSAGPAAAFAFEAIAVDDIDDVACRSLQF